MAEVDEHMLFLCSEFPLSNRGEQTSEAVTRNAKKKHQCDIGCGRLHCQWQLQSHATCLNGTRTLTQSPQYHPPFTKAGYIKVRGARHRRRMGGTVWPAFVSACACASH